MRLVLTCARSMLNPMFRSPMRYLLIVYLECDGGGAERRVAAEERGEERDEKRPHSGVSNEGRMGHTAR